MPIVLDSAFVDKALDSLRRLQRADECDYAYDWDGYEPLKEELINSLAKDVTITIAFLDSLDFNNKVDRHIITFIPEIASRLGRFGAQFLFIEHIKELQKKFSNIDFSYALAWAQLYCGFTNGANGKNATDDGPSNKDVYFGGSL